MVTQPKPLPSEALAHTFDEADCNTGMSLAYAVAKAAAMSVLSGLYTEATDRSTAAQNIAYDLALRWRHGFTLAQIVEAAVERALLTVPDALSDDETDACGCGCEFCGPDHDGSACEGCDCYSD